VYSLSLSCVSVHLVFVKPTTSIGGSGKVHPIRREHNFIDHFLCLPKENEPKEKAPVAIGPSDCPVLLETVKILKTRFAQTIQNPHRHFLWCSASANGKKQPLRIALRPF
jgi:hypothetical protein